MSNNQGDEKAKGALPLVLLHGFPFDGSIWSSQVKALGKVAPVYALDLPGFGEAHAFVAKAPTIERYAEAIAAWAKQHEGLDGMVLAGHSMGGYVALAFARLYPQMLRGLVLVCTRPGPDNERARQGRLKLANEVKARGAQAVVDGMLGKLFAPGADERNPDAVEQTRALMLRQSNEGIIAAIKAMAERSDATSHLSSIKVPTLVVSGSEDAIMAAADADLMAQRIPDAKHVVIEDAGHMPMLENSDDLNKALSDFFHTLQ